jgi:hypothetical protein
MPKVVDHEREDRVRQLRTEDLTVRAITIKERLSPSAISRILRVNVNAQTLSDLRARVEIMERRQERVETLSQAIQILAQLLPPWLPGKREILALFRANPDEGSKSRTAVIVRGKR